MKNYFVYGAGGHALVVMDTAEICGYKITGFIDDFDHREDRKVLGKRVFSPDAVQPGDIVFMGFGNNAMREKIGNALIERGVEVQTLIHPSAVVSKYASIGRGSFIAANAVVDPGCEIGNFVILNKCSVVSHNTVIGDAVHLCPGAVCAGWCNIGKRSTLGIGTIVRERIKIANDICFGGGAVVVKDFMESGTIAYGVPARIH